ncbi:helix-turn-helix domain-containing protein [Croceicoccus sp. BE223]|uniref:helix-turn-helix domain-containing protein n=1 Tax=Croceicoccus sp. BE223 TaxID=2817716 RepID=UPI0038579A19
MDIPQLLTVSDFVMLFRISRTTFYREVNAGRLRIVKLGRSTRISRADAEKWVGNLQDASA